MKMARVLVLGAVLSLIAAPSFAQRGPGFRGGFGGPGGGGPGFLLQMPEVQKELKLDEAQLDLLRGVNEEQRNKMRELFQSAQGGGDRQAMMQKFQALNAETTKKIAEILDEKQMARLKQLEIQQAGSRALARPDVQDQLKLTADQKSKVQQTVQAEGEARRQMMQGQDFQSLSDEQRQELFTKMREMSQQTDGKLLAILTDPQKKQFDSMKGAAFTFPQRRGGPGGPGGRRNNN